MLDYYNVLPDRTYLLKQHFTAGRGGREIRHSTIRHMAGIGTAETG